MSKNELYDGEQLKMDENLLKPNGSVLNQNDEEALRQLRLDNRFGFYNEKTTEELEDILDKLIIERDGDEKIFDTTSNSEARTDAHNDIKFENEQIAYIEGLLKKRKGVSR